MVYSIQDLSDGNVMLHFLTIDSNFHDLRRVLAEAFPSESRSKYANGSATYYHKQNDNNSWIGETNDFKLKSKLPSQLTSVFIIELEKEKSEKEKRQTLSRADIIKLSRFSTCLIWVNSIKELLIENIYNVGDIVIPEKLIKKLETEGTFAQIDEVQRLGLTLKKDISVYFTNSKNNFYSNRHNDNQILVKVRDSAEFAGKALFLNDCVNWEIKMDSKNILVLIPTMKTL